MASCRGKLFRPEHVEEVRSRLREAVGPIAAVFILATVPCLVVKVRASLAFPPVTFSAGGGLNRPIIS
jgi:hypothetical protein